MANKLKIHHWTGGDARDFAKRLVSPESAARVDSGALRVELDALANRRKHGLAGVKLSGTPSRDDWEREAARLRTDDVAVVLSAPRGYLERDFKELVQNGRPRIPDEIAIERLVLGDNDLQPLGEVIGNLDIELWRNLATKVDESKESPSEAQADLVPPGSVVPRGVTLEQWRLDMLARSVCLIEVDSRPRGTGVLIEPGRILTARHVLESAAVARRARVVFDYRGGRTVLERLPLIRDDYQPLAELDAVIVGFVGSERDRTPIPLRAPAAPHPKVRDQVIILQHPAGAPLSIVYRDSEVTGVRTPRFQYTADTQKGSSGAPVFVQSSLALAGIHVRGGELRRLDDPTRNRLTNEGLLATAISAAL